MKLVDESKRIYDDAVKLYKKSILLYRHAKKVHRHHQEKESHSIAHCVDFIGVRQHCENLLRDMNKRILLVRHDIEAPKGFKLKIKKKKAKKSKKRKR